jgi:exosortase/archaeosortase
MMPLLVIHFAVTWALVGLIWTIQVVHYPLLREVGREGFIAYHERHRARITWVVGPLMLAEISSAALLLYLGERGVLFGISLVGLALIWGCTGFCQVPLHRKLARGYDAPTIRRLVLSNIWRSVGWTIRGLCLAALLVSRLK